MNHMLPLNVYVCKKGGYQFIYLYFSLYKNFMSMVKSYLMRVYLSQWKAIFEESSYV